MKKPTVFALVLTSLMVCALERQAILHYDFTREPFLKSGRYAAPQKHGAITVSTPLRAWQFTGSGQYLTVPGSMDLSAEKALTLYALVKFYPEKKLRRDMDMIFFKDGDFLLGRDAEKIYVNVCRASKDGKYNKNWRAACIAPGVPENRWCVLAAVIEKVKAERVRITVYIDGDRIRSRILQHFFHKPEKTLLTLGKGWGGPWYLNGALGRVMIFDRALSHEEISSLVMKETYLSE